MDAREIAREPDPLQQVVTAGRALFENARHHDEDCEQACQGDHIVDLRQLCDLRDALAALEAAGGLAAVRAQEANALREQLRLCIIDAANDQAEANDLREQVARLEQERAAVCACGDHLTSDGGECATCAMLLRDRASAAEARIAELERSRDEWKSCSLRDAERADARTDALRAERESHANTRELLTEAQEENAALTGALEQVANPNARPLSEEPPDVVLSIAAAQRGIARAALAPRKERPE